MKKHKMTDIEETTFAGNIATTPMPFYYKSRMLFPYGKRLPHSIALAMNKKQGKSLRPLIYSVYKEYYESSE